MTRVALLWHMHQPFYQDLVTGEHILPWVRLHAIKDYWGMAALLREFPSVKVTFNLVPSLLVQLEAFAREEARDRHLELGLQPAETLTDEERAFCVDQFFHAHRPRMIDPYPRYAELLARREATGAGLSARSQAAQFSTDDIRDLQVWHKLVWIDAFYFDGDERIRALVAKGRRFTEDDKATLRAVELELLRKVVPEYRDAAARGQIEISTSPFYHPILPLLCDTDVYLRTHPDSRMPRERFRRPEDAAEQLNLAVAYHERLFGLRAVRRLAVGRLSVRRHGAACGCRGPAVDGDRRGDPGAYAGPWLFARRIRQRRAAGDAVSPVPRGRATAQVACGFRDHTLSDLIGFTYASWAPEAARPRTSSDAWWTRGTDIASRTGGGDATIFVILDGENAWEHYEGQGRPFLRALYRRLGSESQLQTVTMADACAGARETLPSIFPGSWINADFYIWIGHADDHRAWSQLVDAHRALDGAATTASAFDLARAREEMFIAGRQRLVLVSAATTIHPTTTSSSTSCSAGTSSTSIARSTSPFRRSCSSATSPRSLLIVTVHPPTGFIDPVHRRGD